MDIIFYNPQYLLFLVSLPILIVFHYSMLRHVRGRLLQFANYVAMSRVVGIDIRPRNALQLFIRLATLSFIIFAVSGINVDYVGFGADSDYVLAIDVSSSMMAADIQPSRIEAAKQAAVEFVNSVPKRTEIGLVSFSGTAFVEQQMTKEKDEVLQKIDVIKISTVGGTDLGEAIISSANLLMSQHNAKTVILLTDGKSNIGVGINRALDYVNENNIQVFTIGVGTMEGGSPDGLNISLKLDEGVLKTIAESTEGEYIHAGSKQEIVNAYKGIITSSKRKITIDLTVVLMFLALIASFVDWTLINTKYRRIP